nr:MAG TPA: hypothetical protein [Caudoviricetes sp.]
MADRSKSIHALRLSNGSFFCQIQQSCNFLYNFIHPSNFHHFQLQFIRATVTVFIC